MLKVLEKCKKCNKNVKVLQKYKNTAKRQKGCKKSKVMPSCKIAEFSFYFESLSFILNNLLQAADENAFLELLCNVRNNLVTNKRLFY